MQLWGRGLQSGLTGVPGFVNQSLGDGAWADLVGQKSC